MAESREEFLTYLNDLRRSVQPVVSRAIKDEATKQVVELSIVQNLAGIDHTLPPAADATDDERFAVDLFRSAYEIDHAAMVLRDYEIYIRRFPYSGTRVSRVRHLRTMVESYFQEIYVLRERLSRHIKLIEKHFAPTRRKLRASQVLDPIREALDQVLESILAARNVHVHEARLSSPNLERLDMIQLLADISDDPAPYEEILMPQYREVRRAWRNRLEDDNQRLSELLGYISMHLRRLVVRDTGALHYPSEYR